jgi:nicotinamide-nucleotide amidase
MPCPARERLCVRAVGKTMISWPRSHGSAGEPAVELFTDATSEVASLLVDRGHTVSVAESSSGGIISARLLSVPGASRYYRGGSVVYTLPSRRAFLDIPAERVEGLEPLTEPMVAVFAEAARQRLDATWGVAELGAAGPAGSRYGHDAGTSVIGVSGPVNLTTTVRTGSDDREQNMWAFADAALETLLKALRQA